MAEIKVNCPDRIHIPRHRHHKPDRKRHLAINPARGVAHCWSCGFATRRNVGALLLELGIQYTNGPIPDDYGDERPYSSRLPEGYSTDFTTVFGQRVLAHLCDERHLDLVTIMAYELGYVPPGAGYCAGRIVIPFRRADGGLHGFQARVFSRPDDEPKYLGPKGMPPFLFNSPRAAATKIMVLTEGPFDALRLPRWAVAATGKGWNAQKTGLVLQEAPRAVIVALDPDAEAAHQFVMTALTGSVEHVIPYRLDAAHGDLGAAPPHVVRSLDALCDALHARWTP